MESKKISILVPVYNSENILPLLLEKIEIERVENNWDLQLLLIEDAGPDNSFDIIEKLSKKYNYIEGYKLARNFGQQAALSFGLTKVTGDFVAIIDDDLQDPPSLLKDLLAKIDDGFDVVYGVRRKRKEGLLKVMMYKLFYLLIRKTSSINMPLDAGDFCVMRKKVVSSMLLLKERNPYLRGIRSWVGFRQTGLEYDRPERFEGETGWQVKQLIRFAFDGIFSFSDLPLKLASIFGLGILLLALSYIFILLIQFFFFGVTVKGFTSTVLLITIFGSANMIFIGVLGEYVSRIYNESKNRPHVIVEKSTL